MTITAQELATELASAGDEDTGIPWGVLARVCEREGLDLHCETCHGLGGHETWCNVLEFNAAGDAADAAWDRGKEWGGSDE